MEQPRRNASARLAVILVMVPALAGIIVTTALFLSGTAATPLFLTHKILGMTLFLFTPVHIYLRKDKLKKLLREVLAPDRTHEDGTIKGELIKMSELKKRSIRDFCHPLGLAVDEVCAVFDAKGMTVASSDQTLEQVAHSNGQDPLKLSAIMLQCYFLRYAAMPAATSAAPGRASS